MAYRNPAINYYVDDVETCVAFYVRHFGFEESFRTPKEGSPDHVEVRLGGFILGLAAKRAAVAMHGLPLGDSGSPRGELVFWTEDVDVAFTKLKADGAAPVSEPHDFLGMLRSAWVADPAGNPIQIVMRLPSH